MSTSIEADRERVWRALTEPSELVVWDEERISPVDAPDGYPFAGQHIRWRVRLGSVPMVMHERPQVVSRLDRIQSSLTLGTMRLEQTYTLVEEPTDSSRTRLSMKLATSNEVPVIGAIIDRFSVRRIASERIDATLRSIQSWCENTP